MSYQMQINLNESLKLSYSITKTSTGKIRSIKWWKLVVRVDGEWIEGQSKGYDPCNSAWWQVKEILEQSINPEHKLILAKW